MRRDLENSWDGVRLQGVIGAAHTLERTVSAWEGQAAGRQRQVPDRPASREQLREFLGPRPTSFCVLKAPTGLRESGPPQASQPLPKDRLLGEAGGPSKGEAVTSPQ